MQSRPRPVLILGALLVVLMAVTTYADIADMVPDVVLNWLRLATVVLGALGTWYVQSVVTPLSSPQAKDGRPLVPTPPARVPDHATRRDLDASAG